MIAQIIPAKRMPIYLSVLDYLVPKNLEKKIKVGQLVKIPLRTKEIYGVVFNIEQESEENTKLKEINDIVIKRQILTLEQLNFLNEISILYHCSLGFLLKNNLMPIKKRKLEKIKELIDKVKIVKNTRKISKPNVFVHSSKLERDKYINDNISKKAQNLILVPEINDIKKIKINEEWKDKVVYVDSNTTEKQMFEIWFDILTKKKNIVIGTRRAILLPWFNLKNIIITSEGNLNYKSWDMAPRFHTRDACIILSKFHKSQLHLLDHSMSVETHFFTKNKVYNDVSKKEIEKKKTTETSIINMCDERKKRNYGFFSEKVIDIIQNTNDGDIFIFLNKRGSASYVGCRDCGHVMKCDNCSNLLTFHQNTNSLKCHYCKIEKKMTKNCSGCNGMNISMFGVGTQLACNEIHKLLPNDTNREIIRIDSDLSNVEKIKDDNENKIIVGTQLAFSYINWSKVKATIFLDADTSLFIPEYKVSESLWYLIQDTIFKMSESSSLLIQTGHPEHTVFSNIFNKNNFYNSELSQRKIFNYPPYRYLLKLSYSDISVELVEKEASIVKRNLIELTKEQKSVIIAGPFESIPYWYRGRYCQILLIKIEYMNYKRDIKYILANLGDNWKIDPNPNAVLTIN